MKRLIVCVSLIMLLCLVIVVLCSCEGTLPSETTDAESSADETTVKGCILVNPQFEAYLEYIDDLEPDRSPLPSFEELRAVTVNMTFSEAKALLGKPQRTEKEVLSRHPVSSWRPKYTLNVYETTEDISVEIAFATYVIDANDNKNEPVVYYIRYEHPDGTVEEFWPEI